MLHECGFGPDPEFPNHSGELPLPVSASPNAVGSFLRAICFLTIESAPNSAFGWTVDFARLEDAASLEWPPGLGLDPLGPCDEDGASEGGDLGAVEARMLWLATERH